MRLPSVTLVQLFVAATLGVGVAVSATVSLVMDASRRSIVERSEEQRSAAAQRVEERLSADLGVANEALDDVEQALRHGALTVDDPLAVEARLFTELLAHPTLSDVALTHAVLQGTAPDGAEQWSQDDRWQLSVFREDADSQSAIL